MRINAIRCTALAEYTTPARRGPGFCSPTDGGSTVAEEFNGVPRDKMFGAIATMKENGELAQF